MRKVAIVKATESYFSNDDYNTSAKLIESITDWQEVTEEEYNALYQNRSKLNYIILELPDPTEQCKIVADSVKSYLKQIEKYKKLEEKYEEERKERAAKKELQRKEREFKKFQELKKKFENADAEVGVK